MSLYRPRSRGHDGKVKRWHVWWLETRVGGIRRRQSLGVRDRRAAEALAAEIVRRLELQLAGVPVPEATAAAPKALIEDYEKEMTRRGSDPQHVSHTVQRLVALTKGTSRLGDLTPEAIRRALGREEEKRGLSKRSVNLYRVAIHGWFAWLVREGKWPSNPVAHVARAREKEAKRKRRALTQEEVRRLVEASPAERAVCYLVAATTGLRRSEMAALTWADVDLEGASIRVRADTAKNRRAALQPIPDGTVRALADLKGTRVLPSAPIFRSGVPSTKTLRVDLAKAGIEYVTEAGVADLHALRVSYATNLARAGVPLVQAQRLMRHSDPKLTANVYTRLEGDDGRAAVGRIDPALSANGTAMTR